MLSEITDAAFEQIIPPAVDRKYVVLHTRYTRRASAVHKSAEQTLCVVELLLTFAFIYFQIHGNVEIHIMHCNIRSKIGRRNSCDEENSTHSGRGTL